jgi:CheY-like chemotaxis protein
MERAPTRQRPLILIVDDDSTFADLVGGVLAEDNYEVAVCSDSRGAVQRMRELRPNAMVLDIMMPEVDGWSVLRDVRSTPEGRDLPVVLMSGSWRQHERQREIGGTTRVAPTVVLPKPFELRDLERTLRQFGLS